MVINSTVQQLTIDSYAVQPPLNHQAKSLVSHLVAGSADHAQAVREWAAAVWET